MKLNERQQLILDLINGYEQQGCVLDEKLFYKYSNKIEYLIKYQEKPLLSNYKKEKIQKGYSKQLKAKWEEGSPSYHEAIGFEYGVIYVLNSLSIPFKIFSNGIEL